MFGKKRLDPETMADGIWEKRVLEGLVTDVLKEQRRTRRWGIFFKLLMFAYLVGLLVALNPGISADGMSVSKPHTALIEIKGVIADDMDTSADHVVASLRDAYDNEMVQGIVLRINSPGGSPVQSAYINSEMHRLKALHPKIPVYAVISDICASGGYYIAVGADQIYANESSIVGSIGVIMNGFGFTETMKKLGVERRLMTAGEHKGFLDPFSPINESEVSHINGMLGQIHQQFIDTVRKGRGDRLKESEEIFSGLVWSGTESLELGLIDGFGSSSYVARELIGSEKLVDYTIKRDFMADLADRFSSSAVSALMRLSFL